MSARYAELLCVIQENDIEKVETLLDHAVSLNFSAIKPARMAIAAGRTEIAIMIIQKRPNIHIFDKHILFEDAIKANQFNVVACLLNHGVSPNVTLSFGDSPICFAAEMHYSELTKVLLKAGGDPDNVNSRHETALYVACREGVAEIAAFLINAGANVNWVNTKNSNFTPLIVAAANDNRDVVALLLKHRVDINAQDIDGLTALWHAYTNSNKQMFALLFRAGAKTDIRNKKGAMLNQEINNNRDNSFAKLLKKYSSAKIHLSPRLLLSPSSSSSSSTSQ